VALPAGLVTAPLLAHPPTWFLVPEAGLALRARIALFALDQLVQRENPGTAGRFAAWPLVRCGQALLTAPVPPAGMAEGAGLAETGSGNASQIDPEEVGD